MSLFVIIGNMRLRLPAANTELTNTAVEACFILKISLVTEGGNILFHEKEYSQRINGPKVPSKSRDFRNSDKQNVNIYSILWSEFCFRVYVSSNCPKILGDLGSPQYVPNSSPIRLLFVIREVIQKIY